MKKILADAYTEAKNLPKVAWIAAAIIPFGIVGVTTYLAGRTVYNKLTKKEEKDDRSENRSR